MQSHLPATECSFSLTRISEVQAKAVRPGDIFISRFSCSFRFGLGASRPIVLLSLSCGLWSKILWSITCHICDAELCWLLYQLSLMLSIFATKAWTHKDFSLWNFQESLVKEKTWFVSFIRLKPRLPNFFGLQISSHEIECNFLWPSF